MEILELINIESSRRRFESYVPFESRPDNLPNIVIPYVVTLWVFSTFPPSPVHVEEEHICLINTASTRGSQLPEKKLTS